MNLVKITPFLLIALCIDGFQFFISLALSAVALFPGTVGGCAIGAEVAGEVGCAALGLVGSIPIVNGVLATVTEPIGIVLGFAISICISFVFGSMLVLFLKVFGLLDHKAALMTYMGEVLPGFSALPVWTALVLRCAYVKAKEELVGGIVSSVGVIAGGIHTPHARPRQDTIERRPTPMQDVRRQVSYAQTV